MITDERVENSVFRVSTQWEAVTVIVDECIIYRGIVTLNRSNVTVYTGKSWGADGRDETKWYMGLVVENKIVDQFIS